jgi:hypothetical protein
MVPGESKRPFNDWKLGIEGFRRIAAGELLGYPAQVSFTVVNQIPLAAAERKWYLKMNLSEGGSGDESW